MAMTTTEVDVPVEDTVTVRPDLEGYFYTDVINCARCGETHRHTLFKKFIEPPPGYTHYATCGRYGEPILMVMKNDGV